MSTIKQIYWEELEEELTSEEAKHQRSAENAGQEALDFWGR